MQNFKTAFDFAEMTAYLPKACVLLFSNHQDLMFVFKNFGVTFFMLMALCACVSIILSW